MSTLVNRLKLLAEDDTPKNRVIYEAALRIEQLEAEAAALHAMSCPSCQTKAEVIGPTIQLLTRWTNFYLIKGKELDEAKEELTRLQAIANSR